MGDVNMMNGSFINEINGIGANLQSSFASGDASMSGSFGSAISTVSKEMQLINNLVLAYELSLTIKQDEFKKAKIEANRTRLNGEIEKLEKKITKLKTLKDGELKAYLESIIDESREIKGALQAKRYKEFHKITEAIENLKQIDPTNSRVQNNQVQVGMDNKGIDAFLNKAKGNGAGNTARDDDSDDEWGDKPSSTKVDVQQNASNSASSTSASATQSTAAIASFLDDVRVTMLSGNNKLQQALCRI